MKTGVLACATAIALAGSAAAKVESSGPTGFALGYEADLAIAPDDAYAKWIDIGAWWSPAHSYSGDAKNMSITPAQGGCWCENLKDGGFVSHLQVAQVQPGRAILLTGGLGPLAYLGVAGSLSVEFKAAEGGTHVTMRYAVGGYDPDGFANWPAAVNGVLGEGFERFKAFAVGGR